MRTSAPENQLPPLEKDFLFIKPTKMKVYSRFLFCLFLTILCLIQLPSTAQTGRVGIGTTSPLAPLHVDSTVLFTGNLNLANPAPLPVSGAGTRMMWYPDRAALRTGQVTGTQWDLASIGQNSFANGLNTVAAGPFSLASGYHTTSNGTAAIALGFYSYASGSAASAIGHYTQATGEYATALGSNTKAIGRASTSLGLNTTTNAYAGIALGRYNTRLGSTSNWIETDPIFEIGIGLSELESANAMTVYKNASALWEGVADETSPAPPPAEGPGTRMMWYPDKGAFRVGYVFNNNWDMDSIGYYSFGSGRSSKAKGNRSTAMGFASQAMGYASTAIGFRNKAWGNYSFTLGHNASSRAYGNFVIGQYNIGGGDPSNWIETDPIFEIGIGASEVDSANAMTVLKSGNVGIGEDHPKESLEVKGAIRVGSNVDESPAAGTIRWNATTQDFEGYTGIEWKSFTASNESTASFGIQYCESSENQVITSGIQTQGQSFGSSVSVFEDYAIIGAIGRDFPELNAGAAHVFHFDGTTWSKVDDLFASDAAQGDSFGSGVAISGNYAIVGAPYKDVDFGSQGQAYIFRRDGASWIEDTILVAPDGMLNNQFGRNVSISDSFAVIGVPNYDIVGSTNSGQVYVFRLTGDTWIQDTVLAVLDETNIYSFGSSVSISGDDLVIGAPYSLVGTNNAQGKVLIYQHSGGSWSRDTIVYNTGGGDEDRLGSSVSISGDQIITGAPYATINTNTAQGQVLVFNRSANTWNLQSTIHASDGEESDRYGTSVSISGEYAVIGTPFKDVRENLNQGKAYIISLIGNSWSEKSILVASDGAQGDRFGTQVTISGNQIMVGAPNYDEPFFPILDTGQAYNFRY